MKIVIPSYARSNQIVKKTLKILQDVNADIFVFVVEEEYELYKNSIANEKINIIIGVKGLANQRNFIADYFEDDEFLIHMDDDIEEVYIKSERPLQSILEESLNYLNTGETSLIGFPPVFNKFWNKTEGFKNGLYYIVGTIFVLKNDKSIRLTNSIGEDFERSVKYYEKYGTVSRNNNLIFKTKYYSNVGGMMEEGRNRDKIYAGLVKLYYQFPHLFKIRMKKMKKEEIVNLSVKKSIVPDIMILPSVSSSMFTDLYKMFTVFVKNPLVLTTGEKPGTGSRPGFKRHFYNCFGMIRPRCRGNAFQLSVASIKFPEIYQELLRIGNIVCPFEFQSIHVVKNCICPPHTDSKNVGKSTLISFGEYEGCFLNINGRNYDAKYTPIIFDGRNMIHYNTDDLVGTKFSLIFY